MREVTWDDAIALISGVGVKCVGEIAALVRDNPDCGVPVIVEYRYGQQIFRDGQLFWPNGQPAPQEYFREDISCLGVVLKNVCEVHDHRVKRPDDERTVRAPEALLGAGQWLGLFEFLDRMCGISDIASPDWSISAGATQLLTMQRVATKGVHNKRNKEYGLSEEPRNLCEAVTPILANSSNAWRVEILFLPARFLALLSRNVQGPEQCSLDQALFSQLSVTAWSSLAKTRHAAYDEILALFMRIGRHLQLHKDVEVFRTPHVIEAAARFAAYLMRVQAGTAVAYTPTMADDEAGPFSEISSMASRWGIYPPAIMRPTYVAKDETGYIRLADIDPPRFSKSGGRNFKGRLEEVQTRLRLLLDNAHEADLGPQQRRHIVAIDDLLLRTMVWLPPRTTEGHAMGWWKKGDKIQFGRMEEGDFFCDAFKGIRPPPKSPFFTAAVRIIR